MPAPDVAKFFPEGFDADDGEHDTESFRQWPEYSACAKEHVSRRIIAFLPVRSTSAYPATRSEPRDPAKAYGSHDHSGGPRPGHLAPERPPPSARRESPDRSCRREKGSVALRSDVRLRGALRPSG